jgi:ABC-type lipoprotein release transport system permease subunit
MGFLGALGGVILGYIEGQILNLLINAVASRFGGESVSLFYSPLWFIMTVIAFGAFVGFMTGVFPARSASRIDTLDALRYK